ncbi:hypothetical protein MPSEU_000375200 [Mayamaea pseudoterrestris]|nr:hypothetical protein MPSEU_000375200 [Mayamaea pseudoterrestris]
MFIHQEREKNNGMINMPLLAYQYGVSLGSLGTACPREDAYTFLEPSQDQLIPFEEGVKYAFDQIPREIQKKILLKLPLDAVDKQALDSRKEMQEAFNTKSERRGGYPSFEEGYNLLYCKLSDNDQQPSPPAAASSLQNSHALANTALSESQASPSRDNLAKIKVGSRIEVFWPEDDEYYPARVDEVRRPFYHINYDDGEEEWLPLDEHEYLLHEDGSESQREIDSVKNEGIRFLKSDYEDAGLQNSEDEGKHVESLSRAITKNTSKIPRRSEPFLTGLANDEQSGYLKKSGDRFTVDGCIIPKQTLRQLNDGTYAAPKGRHPIGTYFDAMRGLFVPYKTRSDAAETDHPLSENDVSHEGQQPIKKRKVLD